MDTDLEVLMRCLKGSDAIIGRTCGQLSLKVSMKVAYTDDEETDDVVIVDRNLSAHLGAVLGGGLMSELRNFDGKTIVPPNNATSSSQVEIYWVTPITDLTNVEQTYIAYGNEASMACSYGNVCLVVTVGPPGERAI